MGSTRCFREGGGEPKGVVPPGRQMGGNMIIRDLELTHFGKFRSRKISLKPGINIIYGRNEAGKSTVHAFIRGMLFGIERQRGKASHGDRYSRYEPWEGDGVYEGKMRLETGGHTYRLERSFLKTNKYFRLIDETEGKELTPPQECLSRLLGGLTEANFINTISVEQLKSATDAALMNELQRFVTNMGSTKSAEIDLARAKSRLLEQKKAMEKKIAASAKEEYGRLAGRLVELDRQLDQLRREEKAKKEICIGLEENLKKAREEAVTAPGASDQALGILRQKAADAGRAVREGEERQKALSVKKRGGPLLLFLCLLCALGGAAAVLEQPEPKAPLFYGGILCALLFFVLLAAGIVRTAAEGKRKKKWLECMGQQEAKKKEAEQAEGQYQSMRRELEERKRREGQMDRSHEQLLQEQKDLARSQVLIEQKEEARQEVLYQGEFLKKTLKENQAIQEEIRAVQLALDTMDDVAEALHDSFGGQLNEAASRYLKRITEGRYDKLVVREDMQIFVNTPAKLIPLSSLSRGTIEQIYLCVRLAAADLLWEQEKMPLIFDDMFAFYDDERLRQTIGLLESLDRQVIIFTCHTRENRFVASHI